MEKKVTKKFYGLSALNLVTIVLLSNFVLKDALILSAVLAILVLNHGFLVKMVNELSLSLNPESEGAKGALKRTFWWMTLKMTLLVIAVALVYFFNKDLIAKALLLMIFQLIIQVVSIKNNY